MVSIASNTRSDYLIQVTWEQRILAGDPKFEASQNLTDFAYADYAQQLGLQGIRIQEPDKIATAWDRAPGADRPCVLDFVTDPEVPPLPAHISWEQPRMFMTSIARGDPNTSGMIRQSFKYMVEAYLPQSLRRS